jgi:hypothetical protein
MKHKPKDDVAKSLRENITLLHKNNLEEYTWAVFEEIKDLIEKGFTIFNDEKRKLYER